MSWVTRGLLAATVLAVFATVFASAIPGRWWQWLIVALVLLVAAAASDLDDNDGPGQKRSVLKP